MSQKYNTYSVWLSYTYKTFGRLVPRTKKVGGATSTHTITERITVAGKDFTSIKESAKLLAQMSMSEQNLNNSVLLVKAEVTLDKKFSNMSGIYIVV